MIEIINLSKSYNQKEIFKDISIILNPNIKYAIVGDNWSGKTTFLRLILQQENLDNWKILFHKQNIQIWYMKQELVIEWNITIWEYIKSQTIIWIIETEMRILEKNLQDKINLDKYWDLLDKYEKLDGYNFEEKINSIINWIMWQKFNLNFIINNLSSWEKSKVLLICSLLSWKDLLLLDEPTNHLDYLSIKWLIDYLNKNNVIALIISHDRYFLDSVTSCTLEIDSRSHKIIEYSGNYSFYEEQKSLNEKHILLEYEKKLAEINKAKKLIEKAKEWTNKWMSNIKKLPDNDKWIKFAHEQSSQNSTWKKIKALCSKMQQIDIDKKPETKKKMKFNLNLNFIPNSSIKFEKLKFGYKNSKTIINIDNLEISKNDKVVILWNNWSGKSTFLKLITWDLIPNSWKIVIPPSLTIWNFTKEYLSLDKNKSVKEIIAWILWNNETEINRILTKFQFNIKEGLLKTSLLSPGQKTRLVLLIFDIKKYNSLLLDEPTNYLDIEAVKKLEENLQEFKGLTITISHDFYFLSKILWSRFLLFEKNTIKEIDSLDEYFKRLV